MISFLLSLLSSIVLGFILVNSYLAQKRGTNAFTKFVRDSYQNSKQTKVAIISLALGIAFTVTASFGEFQFFAGIPNFLVVIASFVLKFKSNKDKERIQSARVVTKGGLEVGAAVAETAGTAVGAVAGAYVAGAKGLQAGAKLGQAVGNMAGSVVSSAAEQMDDVKSLNIQIDANKIAQLLDPGQFIDAARRCGINVEGKPLEVVATEVVECIPDFYKQKFAELPCEELAVNFLSGRMN